MYHRESIFFDQLSNKTIINKWQLQQLIQTLSPLIFVLLAIKNLNSVVINCIFYDVQIYQFHRLIPLLKLIDSNHFGDD